MKLKKENEASGADKKTASKKPTVFLIYLDNSYI